MNKTTNVSPDNLVSVCVRRDQTSERRQSFPHFSLSAPRPSSTEPPSTASHTTIQMTELGTLTLHSAVSGDQYIHRFLLDVVYPAVRERFQLLPEQQLQGGFLLCARDPPYSVQFQVRHALLPLPNRDVIHLDDDIAIPVSVVLYDWPTRTSHVPTARDLHDLLQRSVLLPANTVGTVMVHQVGSVPLTKALRSTLQQCFRSFFQAPNKFVRPEKA
jgi:hypothetical protein